MREKEGIDSKESVLLACFDYDDDEQGTMPT